jgi:glycosyltransferase involved in cell wall biosynthesis
MLERFACRSATRINVLTPAFKEDIVQRGLAVPSRISLIPNGADLENFQPGPRDNSVRREFGWGDRTVFLYAGAHGRANALQQLVDSADQVRERPDILIACAGDGPERPALEAEARRRNIGNIMFCGPQPKARMCHFVNAADVGLAVLQNNPTFRTVYPNKVFDYMACERPVVLAIDGVARKLVCDDAQAGIFATPENAEAIAGALRLLTDNQQLRSNMGSNGRQWVIANASRTVLAESYLALIAEIVRPASLRQSLLPSSADH